KPRHCIDAPPALTSAPVGGGAGRGRARCPTARPASSIFRRGEDGYSQTTRVWRAGGAFLWLSPVLPARRAVCGGFRAVLASGMVWARGDAEPVRAGRLARARDAVRLPRGRGHRLPADGDPQLDRAASGAGLAAARTGGAVAGGARGGVLL